MCASKNRTGARAHVRYVFTCVCVCPLTTRPHRPTDRPPPDRTSLIHICIIYAYIYTHTAHNLHTTNITTDTHSHTTPKRARMFVPNIKPSYTRHVDSFTSCQPTRSVQTALNATQHNAPFTPSRCSH